MGGDFSRVIGRERKAELERKGDLDLKEAAEYLGMAPKTLYNRIYESRTNPGAAPRGKQKRRKHTFTIAELKAWDQRS